MTTYILHSVMAKDKMTPSAFRFVLKKKCRGVSGYPQDDLTFHWSLNCRCHMTRLLNSYRATLTKHVKCPTINQAYVCIHTSLPCVCCGEVLCHPKNHNSHFGLFFTCCSNFTTATRVDEGCSWCSLSKRLKPVWQQMTLHQPGALKGFTKQWHK